MTWLIGWNRRKQLTVNGSSAGSQSDYQMKLTVNQSNGTDSAGVVYLGGNVQTTFNDLRFAKSDGTTLLPYWIESITGTTPNQVATVWIKLAPSPDTISVSPGTYNFYIYYSNTGASSATNGIDTFVFFDDFESGTLDTNKWATQLMYGSMGIRTDYKYGNYSYGSDQGPSQGCCYPNSIIYDQNHYFMKLPDGDNIQYLVSMKTRRWITTAWYSYCYIGFGGSNIAYTLPYDGVWYNYDIILKRTSSSNINYQVAVNGSWETAANITITQGTILPFGIQTNHYGPGDNSVYVRSDDFRVRNYISPEPAFSTTGTEEIGISATSITSDTYTCTNTCQVTITVTWQNLGSSSVTFRPKILIDGTTYVQASSDITIAAYPATSSIQIITPTLSIGTHSICPYPN
jgi:hypothetical protein